MSQRLRDQSRRQHELSLNLEGVASVPQIFDDGVADDCYWFDMEFIAGVDAVDYLAFGTRQRLERLAEQIGLILEVEASKAISGQDQLDLHRLVLDKLDEINQVTGNVHYDILLLIRQALGENRIFLEPTIAHGDLTLENILIDKHEKLWLIDAIGSPINHYWTDLAKLFQDLVGRWYKHRGRNLSIGLTRTMTDHIFKHAIKLDLRYSEVHSVLLALTFARILPYCKYTQDVDFVTNKIHLSLEFL